MPKNLSWANFDKAFWVSSTNIRNIIQNSIDNDADMRGVGNALNQYGQNLNTINGLLSGIQDQLDSIVSGGGGGGGGTVDPTDPVIVNLQQKVKALEQAVESHGKSLSDIRVELIKLDARVTTLEGKV